ncbi:hypothetical protein ABPG74_021002 [Tetrahymena malaccensis]
MSSAYKFKAQSIFLIILLLKLCLFCLGQTNNCQQEIEQQLQLQSIQYICQDNQILIQNQQVLSFKLDLYNLNLRTNLIMQNVQKIQIESINILSCQVQLGDNQQAFLSIFNIQILEIGLIQIQETLAQEQSSLITFSQINQMQIKQFTINAAFLDNDISSVDKKTYFNPQELKQEQQNQQDLSLVQIKGNQIYIEQLIICRIKGKQVIRIFGDQILQINQVIFGILDEGGQKENSNTLFEVTSSQQCFIQQISFITEQIQSQQQKNTWDIHIHFIVNYLLNIGSFDFKDIEVFFLSFYIDKQIVQNQNLIQNVDGCSVIINKFTFIYLQESQNIFDTKIADIENLQINQIIVENQNSFMWDFQINKCKNLQINQLMIRNTKIQKSDILKLNQIDKIILDYFIIYDQMFDIQVINVQSSNLQIKNFNIENSQINSLILSVSSCFNIEINNFSIKRSLILNQILKFYLVKIVKISNFNYLALQKQNDKQYFDGNKSLPYLILLNDVNIFTLESIEIDFNNNQYGLIVSKYLGQLVLEKVTLKNAYAINGGGFQLQSYDLETKITIKNSSFSNFTSIYFGGCIYGGQIHYIENVEFKYCSSYIGGALYISNNSDLSEIQKINFYNNKAAFYGPNYSLQIQKIIVNKMYEYNPQFLNTSLFLKELDIMQFFIVLQRGINYIIGLQFLIDNQYYPLNNQSIESSNMFYYLQNQDGFQSDTILNVNFPFLQIFLDAYSNTDYKQITLQIMDQNYQIDFGRKLFISNDCLESQEKIEKYKTAQDKLVGRCEPCNNQYFSFCYAYFSEIRDGYWRKSYSIESEEIIPCSISPSLFVIPIVQQQLELINNSFCENNLYHILNFQFTKNTNGGFYYSQFQKACQKYKKQMKTQKN